MINDNEKMLKMKTRSQRYDINRPKPRPGHKCTKYKMCLYNDDISIHEKGKTHWGWVEKNVAY